MNKTVRTNILSTRSPACPRCASDELILLFDRTDTTPRWSGRMASGIQVIELGEWVKLGPKGSQEGQQNLMALFCAHEDGVSGGVPGWCGICGFNGQVRKLSDLYKDRD